MVTFTYKTPFSHFPLYDEADYLLFHEMWKQNLLALMRLAMANTTFIKPLEIPGRDTEADDR